MRIKSIVHVVAAWIMLVLTSEFSLTVAYDICDTNPWARILYVALNISGLLAAFYLYTRYIMKIKMQDLRLGKPFPERQWCKMSSLLKTCFGFLSSNSKIANSCLVILGSIFPPMLT